MRLSAFFGQTQRQVARYAPEDGRYWLLRAAYWHEGAARLWLPLGMALRKRLVAHLEAAAEVAFQPVDFPPLDGAWPPALPQSLEELLAAHVASYRQLPRWLLARRGERLTALVLDADPEAAREAALRLHGRWEAALQAVGLPLGRGEGAGAQPAPAAVSLAPAVGGEKGLRCPQCGYRALQPWARRAKPCPETEPPQPLTPVETPAANTIRALADFLQIPESRTAKAVFLQTVEAAPRLVFAVVRGDMQVSAPKLARLLGVERLQPATEEAIRTAGAVPGYASPIGTAGALVVVDDLIPCSPNLVAGANREGFHFTGVNYGRDFQADVVADIVAAEAGDPCPHCGAPLEACTAWPVVVSQPMTAAATYLTPQGKPAPVGVAAVQVNLAAAVAGLAEHTHREDGLAWHPAVAPYDVHLVALKGGEEAADALYALLQEAGLKVLYDDRKASPGVKFTDADLFGLPWRVTVGRRSLKQGGAEVKPRTGEARIVPLDEVLAFVDSGQEIDARPQREAKSAE